MFKTNILISACLLGSNCRYDGKSKYYQGIEALKEKYNLIPVCPEVLGGLSIPRIPSEIINGKVINKEGIDNTIAFLKGANKALDLYYENNCAFAILKESSPSCGLNLIYDGSFSGKKVKGMGITALHFIKNGIKVYTEDDIEMICDGGLDEE